MSFQVFGMFLVSFCIIFSVCAAFKTKQGDRFYKFNPRDYFNRLDQEFIVHVLNRKATPPVRQNDSAGYDLFSSEDVSLRSRLKPYIIKTDIAVELPKGTYGRIADRSSMAKKGISVTGVIDIDYQGEIKIILTNNTGFDYDIDEGDCIAQMVLEKHLMCPMKVIPFKGQSHDPFSERKTKRGTGGFGSSGR